jgi:hypothetical protein
VFSGVRHGNKMSSDVVLSCVIVTFTAPVQPILSSWMQTSSLAEPRLSHLEGKNRPINHPTLGNY